MSDALPSGNEGLSLSALARVDDACDRFEAAWKSASAPEHRPRVEDFLGESPGDERGRLLQELIHLDVFYRRRAGQQPAADEYFRRFPHQKTLLRDVFAEAEAAIRQVS